MMIRCIIVEDEVLAQQVIQNYLRRIPGFQLMAVCKNASEALDALKTFEVDLVFLDIQLPGITGLNFLRSLPNPPLAILTTAYAEYALESYEFSIIDYLLKPISFERFSKAINKITNGRLYTQFTADRNPDANDHIFVKSGNKFFRVNFSEIIYIEAMKDYLRIHANEYKIVTLQTMSEMEKLLPSKQFLRIHKSFIVATTHIKSVYGSTVETAKATLPIGLNYKNNVMNFISGS